MDLGSLSIKIIESNVEISNRMRDALTEELNKKINQKLLIEMKIAIGQEIKKALLFTPEAQALIGGDLKGEFGIPYGKEDAFVKRIISTIADNIEVEYNKLSFSGAKISGGFTFYVAKANFEDILALPEATITTEKGQILPWLDWLLLKGDRLIIKEYSILFYPKTSRSHSYVMVKDSNSFWKVPSEYSGTVRNNWITRGLDNTDKQITNIIGHTLAKVFA